MQIRVRFSTSVSSLQVPNVPIAVPETLGRFGLSEVINHLLGRSVEEGQKNGNAPLQFDILIDGTMLRTQLNRYIQKHSIGGENVLDLEYIPALRKPTPSLEEMAPDWVSSVSSHLSSNMNVKFIAATCYDGILRILNEGLKEVSCVKASGQPLTVHSSFQQNKGKGSYILVGGKEKVLSLWLVDEESNFSLNRKSLLYGHEESVSSLDTLSLGDRVIATSGDWNGRLCLWNLSSCLHSTTDKNIGLSEKETNDMKRTKKSEDEWSASLIELKPDSSFKAHSQVVSGCVLTSKNEVQTASFDRSLKIWDSERQDCVHTFSTSKAVTCLDSQSGEGNNYTATGHPDQKIRIFDVRIQKGETLAFTNLLCKGGWIYGIKWRSNSSNHIASVSIDGNLNVWDIRSKLPLHTISAHNKSALCIDWYKDTILTGGQDGIVRSFSIPALNFY